MSDFSSFKDSSQSYGLVFWQTFSLWNRQIKSGLKKYQLSHTQFVILNVIAYLQTTNYNVSQRDVSKFSNIDVMTLSTSLKTLIKNNYIVSHVNKEDSRANTLSLTQLGSEVQVRAIETVETIDRSFFEIEGVDLNNFMTSLHIIKDRNADNVT